MAYGPWGNEASASTRFSGTWITDPDSPASTVVRLRYSGVGKQNAQDRAKTALQFVGRRFPVYEVGDARAESVNVDATLSAEDGDATEQLELLQSMIGDGSVVLYRDGRGRKMYAMGTDFQSEDLDLGSYKVSFLLNRVDYDEALPTPTALPTGPVDNQPKNVNITVDNYSGMAMLDWDDVPNAQLYRLLLDGVEVGTTTESATTYGPLKTGDYTIAITATVNGISGPPSSIIAFSVNRPTTPETPSNNPIPQNFRATPSTTANSVVFNWDAVPGATEYQLFEARSPNGVANGITTATTMTRGLSPGLADGPFDYWVRAKVNGVYSAESNHQKWTFPFHTGDPITGGQAPPAGGGGSTVLPDPVDVLGLRNGDPGYLHYNLGCGFTDSKGHKDYTLQTMEDWSAATALELKNNYYTVKDAAGKYAVAMTVEPTAATTSPNTHYPRCEHREMQQTDNNGANKSNWTIDTNDHDFGGFSRIMTLPPAKPGVCFNQCHDQQDDTIMLRTESVSGSIAVCLNVYGTRVKIMNSNYTLGREIYSRFRINNKVLTVYYAESTASNTSAVISTTVNYTHPSNLTNSNPPWYHKFGCYAQSNGETDTSGTKCLVYQRDWKQWHTGWPAPVTGAYAGPG